MKEIILTQGKVALVDDEDFDRVSQFKWHAQKRGFRFYGARNVQLSGGASRLQYLHCFIMGEVGIDHRDGEGLNDRKYNLRRASTQQNNRAFRRKSIGVSSQYRGVRWHSRDLYWTAQIKLNNRQIHLGQFDSEEEAARAYDEAAKTLFGDFASLNFPLTNPAGRATIIL